MNKLLCPTGAALLVAVLLPSGSPFPAGRVSDEIVQEVDTFSTLYV